MADLAEATVAAALVRRGVAGDLGWMAKAIAWCKEMMWIWMGTQ